jgi:hypothetical protein
LVPDSSLLSPDSLFSFKLPEYDLFLIGDGSGTTIGNPGGWCCLSFADFSWSFFAGYLNSSTNNFSELIPYIHALWDLRPISKSSFMGRN